MKGENLKALGSLEEAKKALHNPKIPEYIIKRHFRTGSQSFKKGLSKEEMAKLRAKRKNKLTPKERIFIRELVSGKNKSQSALAAYNTSKKNASIVGNAVLKRPKVQNALARALEKAHLDEDFGAEKLRKLLEEGEVNLDQTRPSDYLQGLKMLFQLKGYLGNNNKELKPPSIEEQANKMSVAELERALQVLDEKQKRLLSFIERKSAKEGEIVK